MFLRPRKFGKTLFTSVLENYYDIQKKDQSLKIGLFYNYYLTNLTYEPFVCNKYVPFAKFLVFVIISCVSLSEYLSNLEKETNRLSFACAAVQEPAAA